MKLMHGGAYVPSDLLSNGRWQRFAVAPAVAPEAAQCERERET
jgi:hypothetical protein